jgi:uncharacterized phiE125 gp8 family phage protein
MDTIVFGTPQKPTATITPYRSLVRVVMPVVEPVSLSLAKSQCRVDSSHDDEYILSLIASARQFVEDTLDITLCTSVWETRYDLFPVWAIVLPRTPMQAKNVTVTYRSGSGATSTITSDAGDFQIDANTVPGRIYPQWARAWPPTRGDENSVVVRYSAGYGDSGSSVPPSIRHLMMILVAHWYESREPVTYGQGVSAMDIPYTVQTLLASNDWGVYR